MMIQRNGAMILILFIALRISSSLSADLDLKTNGSVSIKTVKVRESFEKLEYEKYERSSLDNSLKFILSGNEAIKDEKISLKINNETVKINVFNRDNQPSVGYAYYVIRELQDKNIVYEITYRKVSDVKVGIYEFTVETGGKQKTAKGNINSPPIAQKFTKLKLGLVGDPMRITCKYDSFPNVERIVWKKLSKENDASKPSNFTEDGAEEITNNDRYEIVEGKQSQRENDTLFIKSLKQEDIGMYMCKLFGRSENNTDFAIVRINVKDRWAALYPFFGIVAEVIVLVTAILAYEKYQLRSQNKNRDPCDEDKPIAADGDGPNQPGTNNIPLTEPAAENEKAGDSVNNVSGTGNNDSLRQRGGQNPNHPEV